MPANVDTVESQPQSVESPGVKGTAARSVVWTVAQQFGTNAIRLAGNLVLTRLLFPEAFGRLALTQTLFFAAQMLTDVGLRDSVIRHERGDDPVFLDTVWTLKVIRGLIISSVACVLAFPYASFYGEPELVAMIWALAGAGVIDAFGSTKVLRLARHLALGRVVLIELGTQITSLITMMALAWKIHSAWALIGGHIAGATFHTIASFLALPGRNDRFRLEPEARRDVTTYGRWIVISSTLTLVSSSADTLVFAKYGGVGAIGVYAIAANLASFPSNVLASIADRVVFPLYSRFHTEGHDVPVMFERATKPLLILGGWGIASVVAVAQPLIDTLYDDRYSNAGSMLKVLALGAWFELLAGNIASIFKALGAPMTVAMATAGRVVVLVALLAPVTHYFGMSAGLFVLAASSLARWVVSGALLSRRGIASWRWALMATVWIIVSGWVSAVVAARVTNNHILGGLVAVTVTFAFWCWPVLRVPKLLSEARATSASV